MIDREKVLKALECIKTGDGCVWFPCPYGFYGESDCRASRIIHDAIVLLKEPDPHLMTVEELDALPVGAVVWEEFYNAEEQESTQLEPAMKTNGGILMCESGYSIIMDGMGDPDIDRNAWRWWSSRPTEEQRKAAKWV